jgi:hypothetical protein
MQRRIFVIFAIGALGAALAACGGAHDGRADLEPDPQAAPLKAEAGPPAGTSAAPSTPAGQGE